MEINSDNPINIYIQAQNYKLQESIEANHKHAKYLKAQNRRAQKT